MDLEKFEQFRRKFDPSFVSKNPNQGGNAIKWPTATNQAKKPVEEDDLYSWLIPAINCPILNKLSFWQLKEMKKWKNTNQMYVFTVVLDLVGIK